MKRIYLIVLLYLIQGAGLGQTTKINLVKNQLDSISRAKFDNPPAAVSSLTAIVSDSQLPDSIRAQAFREMSICYGMMNKIDSGILVANQSLELTTNLKTRVLLYRTLGMLYAIGKYSELADSCFKLAIKGIDQIPENPDLKAAIFTEYANYFFEKYDYANNLKLLKQAILVRSQVPNDPPRFTAMLKQKMAVTFMAMGNYKYAEKENRAIVKLLENSKEENRFSHLGYAYQMLGVIKQHEKDYKASDAFFDLSINNYKTINNENLLGFSLSQKAKNQGLKGQSNQGLPMIREAFPLMKKANSGYILEAATIYLNLLASQQQFKEGTTLLSDSLVLQRLEENYTESALEFLKASTPFYESLQQKDAVIRNLKLINKIADSVFNIEKVKKAAELQVQYADDLKEKNEKILLQENKLLSQSNLLRLRLLIIWVVLAGCVLLYVFIRLGQNRLRLEKKTGELLVKEHENWMLHQKVETEVRNLEMKEAIIDEQKQELQLHNEKISQLQNQVLYATNKSLESEKEEIKKHLQKLKEGKENLELFMVKFNAIFPDFCQKLLNKFPALNNSDLVFCALCRINLTTKEISSVLNIESLTVYKRKYRVMEKMGVDTDDQFRNEVLVGI